MAPQGSTLRKPNEERFDFLTNAQIKQLDLDGAMQEFDRLEEWERQHNNAEEHPDHREYRAELRRQAQLVRSSARGP